MSTFVLIHGAWHGAWCWDKVKPLLERAGHRVVAPDLPGHGQDKLPTAQVTLQAYADRVCEVLDAEPEPVVLVGHSMGGAVITQTAEQRPGKIRRLVYVAGMLLQDGQAVMDQRAPESLVAQNVQVSEDRVFTWVRPEALKPTFYADCPDADVERARALLVHQALAPIATPVHTTPGRFGRVPRVYIECLQDKAIPNFVQKRMFAALPCERVFSLDTSHSPFFSAPDALVAQLLSAEALA